MRSLKIFVYFNPIPMKFNIQLIQSDIGNIGFTPHTEQYLFRFDGRSLSIFFYDDSARFHFYYFSIQVESDSTFCIFRTKHTTGFLIHDSQYLRHHLDNMHFHSHTVEERSKLHSYDSTTYNNQRFRKLFDLQSLF